MNEAGTVDERHCSALNRKGERCRAVAGNDGLCSVHSGRTDPGKLGRLSGKARRRQAEPAEPVTEVPAPEEMRAWTTARLVRSPRTIGTELRKWRR